MIAPGSVRIVVAVSILATGTAIAVTRVASNSTNDPSIALRPVQVADDDYSSSSTCRSCHPTQYDTWHRSYHRTMTQVATPAAVRADFDGERVDAVPGRPMILERNGDQFWAAFDDQDWDGTGADGPPRIRRQVVLVTGSHHQQVYWYATGHTRLVGQLPAIYLLAERKWIQRNAAFLRPP